MKTAANYNCSQPDLYLVCRDTLSLYYRHMAAFNAARPRYNATHHADLVNQLLAAKRLPDEQTRNSITQRLYAELQIAAEKLLQGFRLLRLYIEDAFPDYAVKPSLDAAGDRYYTDASHNSWDDCDSICNNASNFIAANTAELLANGNMDPDFPAEWDDLVSKFTSKHADFITATKDAEDATRLKIIANNAIYLEITKLLQFGATIFSHDAALKEKFTFAYQLSYIKGRKAAGFYGIISDKITNLPIVGAIITLTNADNSYDETSNDDGAYDFSPMASGIYTLKCSAEGYLPITLPAKEVLLGTTSKLLISLQPDPASATPPANSTPPSSSSTSSTDTATSPDSTTL